MKVLLVSSRFPWPPFTGDRLRATIWLSALEKRADVWLVAPNGTVPPNAPFVRFYPASWSLARGAAGALRVAGELPFHSLLAAPYDWEGAIERARRDAGDFDATIVLLSRLDPWLDGPLPRGGRVLDAIDSLRRNMSERTREASPWTRWFWRVEERRVARAEQAAVREYDRVVVVSEEDSAELGAVVVSNGALIAPPGSAPRVFDFGFWGRLAYFANADAVSWLVDEIWPAVRALRPDATLVIAGADAPRRLRSVDGHNGIAVQSPVDDIAALAREVKVALFPVRYGSGVSNKVLEAAEGGCAIVGTPQALRGLDAIAAHAVVATDANAIARAAADLIADESRREAMAAAVRGIVEATYARSATLDRLVAIVEEAAA